MRHWCKAGKDLDLKYFNSKVCAFWIFLSNKVGREDALGMKYIIMASLISFVIEVLCLSAYE